MTRVMQNEKTLEAINRVYQAISDIQAGKMVVMVDDEDRENEGDLVYAASLSTPEKVNFMASQVKRSILWPLKPKGLSASLSQKRLLKGSL